MYTQYISSSPNEVYEEMTLHLEKFQLSGLTQLEYCRLNKLSYARLVYWMRKTRRQELVK
jgi:hypothetical protein